MLHRINAGHEDDRNGRGGGLCCKYRAEGACCDDDGRLTMDQIFRQRRQPVVATLRPAIFDRHVLTLDVAGFGQALTELGPGTRGLRGGKKVEEPDDRHRRLLRPRRERPRGRSAPEQRDELATPDHSITSSARCWRNQGTSRPSALAVLRLITSSNFVGCSTGRSAGLAPLRILPI